MVVGTLSRERSAAALTTKTGDERCAFSLEGHLHENCEAVSSINDRKVIVRKYRRYLILDVTNLSLLRSG